MDERLKYSVTETGEELQLQSPRSAKHCQKSILDFSKTRAETLGSSQLADG